MNSDTERSNFLRQCWRTGHWQDGVGTILFPLRMSLYQWRRSVQRTRSKGSQKYPVAVPNPASPNFSCKVHPVFCDNSSVIDEDKINLSGVFEEAEDQLHGDYRLAGGRCGKISTDTIETREDAEDIHAFHRLYWACRYAVAGSFGHVKSRNALLAELPRWFGVKWKNPALACWPYTVAERITSLTVTLFWIERTGVKDLSLLVPAIKHQLWKDGLQLAANLEFGLGVHNHILNDARGLFHASAALAGECDESTEWRKQSFEIWDEYFPKLVLPDGTFAEQSSHYHLLLCRTALEYWLACRRAGHSLPEAFENRIRAMFDLANELLRADGSLPRFGDNSPDHTIKDLWGILAAGHYYGLLESAPRHSTITPLTIFYCGACPEIPKAKTPANCRLFPIGGFAFLRSPSLDAELVAHGDAGNTVGAHGDAGRGSYELWWNGRLLVCEPGSFFSSSDKNWKEYQSARSQNVTSLDGLSPVITKPDQRYATPWYVPEGGGWEALPDGGVRFQCTAFRRLHKDITLVRTWRFEQPDMLRFEERIEGSNRVEFESHICLGDSDWSFLEKGKLSNVTGLQWKRQDGSSAQMSIQAPAGITIASRDCTFLPEYGVEKRGRSLVLNGSQQQLPFSWTAEWRLRKSV